LELKVASTIKKLEIVTKKGNNKGQVEDLNPDLTDCSKGSGQRFPEQRN
jgi:sporulation protein YlmC with PRC-barrel domain